MTYTEHTGLAVSPKVAGALAGFSESGTTVGDLIKPLKTEIHLFDTYVANANATANGCVAVSVGDRLSLRRIESKFDDNEIALYADDVRIGRIPEKDNVIFARLLDAGKCLEAKVTSVKQIGSLTEIRVGIYLIDF